MWLAPCLIVSEAVSFFKIDEFTFMSYPHNALLQLYFHSWGTLGSASLATLLRLREDLFLRCVQSCMHNHVFHLEELQLR